MNRKFGLSLLAVVTAAGIGAAVTVEAQQNQAANMSFFITSANPGKGADFGGLEGADAYCAQLAKAAGARATNWKAYLSTTGQGGDAGVNARDRIGKGPWRNAKGVVIAMNVNDLHSSNNKLNKQTALTEKSEMVKGRGDTPNQHDILTGSDPQGMFSTAGGDTTCGNWTKGGEGSAIVGHHDLQGLKPTRHMMSWNSSHGTRGCGLEQLRPTGGEGLIYCFAAN